MRGVVWLKGLGSMVLALLIVQQCMVQDQTDSTQNVCGEISWYG